MLCCLLFYFWKCVFILFFLISLTSDRSNLLFFQKNQLIVFFFIVFFYCTYFSFLFISFILLIGLNLLLFSGYMGAFLDFFLFNFSFDCFDQSRNCKVSGPQNPSRHLVAQCMAYPGGHPCHSRTASPP